MEEKIKIYEKCNIKTEKEIWDIVKDIDFKNPSTIRILDIGCGPGNAFFHFFVKFGTSNFTGIEMNCLHQIKKIDNAFKYYGVGNLLDDLIDYYNENQKTIDPYFYFKKLVEYEILKLNTKINEDKFKSLFMDKIHWGTKIEQSNIFKNTSDQFDLILLSKVLHYKDIKDPDFVIKNCINLLTEGGLIFIKSPKSQESKKLKKGVKRKVDEKTFEEWTKDLNEYREIENDNDFFYFLGKK